jgi:hypothetical protein
MSNSLYDNLIKRARKNPSSIDKYTLDCLNKTLDHFEIEEDARVVVGETILRMSKSDEQLNSSEVKSILLKHIFSYFVKLLQKY